MGFAVEDIGALVLRLTLAGTLFAHGTQKLLGWFSGSGITGTAAAFERMGQRPGRAMVIIAGFSELVAAASLSVGFGTPLGTAAALGTMLVAGSSLTVLSGTVWNANRGGEYPLFIALVVVAMAFIGPGRISVDHAIGAPWFTTDTVSWSIACVLLACLLSSPVIYKGRRTILRTRWQEDVSRPEAARNNAS